MVRTQLYFTMSSTWGIQLHVSALYIAHCQVLLTYQGTIQNACEVSWGEARSRLVIVDGMALDLWRGININIVLFSVLFQTSFELN